MTPDHFLVFAHGEDASKAYPRASGIPAGRSGAVLFERPKLATATMTSTRLLLADRYHANPDEAHPTERKAWEWLVEQRGLDGAWRMLTVFTIPNGPSVCFHIRRATKEALTYKLHTAIGAHEGVYAFTGKLPG